MVGFETVCEGSVRAERGDGICALGLEGVSEKCEIGGDDEDEISQSRHGSRERTGTYSGTVIRRIY